MTQKDYRAIALAIKTATPTFKENDSEVGTQFKTISRTSIGVVAEQIAEVMKKDNPRFNKRIFMDACGF